MAPRTKLETFRDRKPDAIRSQVRGGFESRQATADARARLIEEISKFRDTMDIIVYWAEFNHFKPGANTQTPAVFHHTLRAPIGQNSPKGFGWLHPIPEDLKTWRPPPVMQPHPRSAAWGNQMMYGGGGCQPMVQLQQVHGGLLTMSPQPRASQIPHHHDGSTSASMAPDEASGSSRRLRPMISDSDHRLKTAENEAKTEEALCQASKIKRQRLEDALQIQALQERIVANQLNVKTEATKSQGRDAFDDL